MPMPGKDYGPVRALIALLTLFGYAACAVGAVVGVFMSIEALTLGSYTVFFLTGLPTIVGSLLGFLGVVVVSSFAQVLFDIADHLAYVSTTSYQTVCALREIRDDARGEGGEA